MFVSPRVQSHTESKLPGLIPNESALHSRSLIAPGQ